MPNINGENTIKTENKKASKTKKAPKNTKKINKIIEKIAEKRLKEYKDFFKLGAELHEYYKEKGKKFEEDKNSLLQKIAEKKKLQELRHNLTNGTKTEDELRKLLTQLNSYKKKNLSHLQESEKQLVQLEKNFLKDKNGIEKYKIIILKNMEAIRVELKKIFQENYPIKMMPRIKEIDFENRKVLYFLEAGIKRKQAREIVNNKNNELTRIEFFANIEKRREAMNKIINHIKEINKL